MFKIAFLVVTCIYLQVVIGRDKKYRKEMQRIAKRKDKVTKVYVPADMTNVIKLSDYRRKTSPGSAS